MAEEKMDLEALLAGAKEHEERYDWGKAAEDYDRILVSLSGRGPGNIGDILERKAFALYKSALQAESINDFRRVADSASGAYSEAQSLLEKGGDGENAARARRCQAMLALLGFYRSETAEERRETSGESWALAMDALAGFELAGNTYEYIKTFNDLTFSAITFYELVPDFETRKKAFEEALNAGENAVKFSSKLKNDRMRIRTLVMASSLLVRGGHHNLAKGDPRDYCSRASSYWEMAEGLSRRDALMEIPFAAFLGDAPFESGRGMEGSYDTFLEALDIVRESRDRFMIGHALAGISFYADWSATGKQTTEEMKSFQKQALDYALEARTEFSKIGFIGARGANLWVQAPEITYYCFQAFWEKDPALKRQHAQRSLEYFPEMHRLAKLSGYTHQIACSLQNRGNCLDMLAETESDTEAKRRLLQEAVRCIKASVVIMERFEAGCPFNLGLWHMDLSEAQGNLAEVAIDAESRIKGLEEAVESMKAGIDERDKGIQRELVGGDPAIIRQRAISLETLGRLHSALYESTSSPESLKAAIECFEKAAEMDSGIDAPSRAAESLWQAGRLYDRLENHEKAADMFLSASAGYRRGAEMIPLLERLYSEYATYLEAWAEFENARHHHARQEYLTAGNHFEKAAQLFDSLPSWRFLTSNFRAWALLDRGESHSRDNRFADAATGFTEAADLFRKDSASLEKACTSVENADEKKMITRLLSASEGRSRYCGARAEIERAHEMDMEGKHSSSCKTYGHAADVLEELAESAPSEQDRRELRLIAMISRAWQSMTHAEATFSPESYEDAARLFEEAKDLTEDPKTKALTLGHSRFCRALEAGVRFTDSRDETLHESAVKHLESASGYYLRADSETCSEYARASRLLFDAHALLDEAAKHKNRKDAAKAYALADEVLKASAESFEKAGQKAKTEQVRKMQGRVRKEKELAISLMQVFETPASISSTVGFRAPTPTQETAAGLDRFMHAEVQATIIARPVSLNVGEEFKLEIELVNAGNGTAQLTKVEEIIPEGFEIKEVPERYRLEDSYLNMRGRKLDGLKTEDIRVIMRPATKGHFKLRPRILYLDDAGRYRSHEPEPVDVTVKELGISGWLRGADSKR